MKKLFLAISILLVIYVKNIETNCFTQTPAGFTSDQFYSSPHNVTIEACDISNENSCCTNELSRTISQYTDSWTSSFLSQFGYTTTTCKGAIQGLSCLLCSADQQSFTSFHGTQFQYFLCSSYCSELLTACTSSKLSNNSFVSIYGDDSVSFCFKVFEGLSSLNVSLVVSNTDDYCWNDEPVCDEDSYYYEYTQCVGGSRSKVWQKKPEVVCSGGLSLPPPVTGLPCALSCSMGQMATQNGCANCNVGKYSLGSAIREDAWSSWDSLSVPFQTYCTYQDIYRNEHVITDVPCGWTLTGGFEINSGALNNSQSSYLETSVVLIDSGALAFDFKVDAEPRFDGLTVYVDRQIALPKVSTQLDFTLQIINLTAGYHFIQFIYSKDASISEGLDQATLNLVQLSPVNFASDECLDCRAGRFQNQTGKSFCYDCPANTYSAAGSFRCTKCPPNYYSYSGSASCTPQSPCTTDDVYYLYGECYFNNDNELVQDQYPVWNTPHTCNDNGNPTPNYSNITNPCSQCNAGQYRSGTTCEFCADGYYSSGTEDCQLCTAGSAAAKILLIDHFDSFTDFLTTDCSYFCGSPGWELHDEYIDSGSGHGRYVNSNLHLNTTLISPGYIQFKFSLVCSSVCSFTFTLSGSLGGSYTGGPNAIFPTVNQTVLRDLPTGDNSIVFTFTKNDPDNIIGRNDYARIEYIYVSNVQEGGAERCEECPVGHYSSSDASSICQKCPVGTYANVVGSTECIPCADGFFNTDEGQTSCISCGEGTHSTPDRTGCIITCTFLDTSMIDYSEGDNNNGVYYDLTPLGRTDDEMYGPVYDSSNQAYYLNLCVKEHNNNTCIDVDGDPLYTFACQVTVLGIGMDLGNIFGILPLRHEEEFEGELEREGVTVHLTNGATCLNTTTGTRFPRQTYIDVLCDPNSGIGTPYPMFNNLTIETSKCVYDFKWYSLYGCHVCNEDDYTYIITACDNNQKRYIQYLWVDNPKRCHSGVSLPETQELSCVNTDATYCPPGQYLDLAISQPVCVDADPGFYSIGGGSLYNEWISLPDGFSSISWTSVDEGAAIRSGFGDSSLFYLHDFVEVGEVTITFKVFGYGNVNEGFTVSLDNEPIFDSILSTNGVWTTIKITDISVGHRFITFEFKGGFVSTKKDEDIGVMISTIKVLGTSHAAEYQLACEEGYYSEGGAEICTPCPANSFAANPSSDSCDLCPVGSYSFLGASACSFQVPCTLGNFQKTFSICNEENNQREILYIPLQPFICDPSELTLPSEDPVSCDSISCEPGEYRSSSSSYCATCQVGYYWDSDKQSCSQSAPGYAGILLTGYYNHEEILLPEAFSTGCSGAHCSSTSKGWRSRSTYLDSGDNGAYSVDIYLDLDVDLTFDGSISFQYSVKGDKSVGVYFFIDGKQQSLSYHPSSSSSRSNSIPSFNLLSGKHTIRWVYHQDEDSMGNANITNIIVTGAGGATSQTECPAGTYSNSFGSNQCIPCAVGTFSSNVAATSCSPCADQTFTSEEASTHCQSCGDLTQSNSDHTDCYTDCSFSVTNGTVDLSPLSSFTSLYDINSISAKLWLNVCQKKTSSVYCIDPITGNSISTYSCQVDSNGSGIDSGNLLSVDVDDNSIVMTYSNGQTTEDCANPISTEITFVCDPNDDESQPQVVNGSTECHLKLLWAIAFACPVCRAEDYVSKSTDCVDDEQTTANIRNSACYGPLVTNSETVNCHEPIHINIWIIIVVIAVFIVLVVIVIAIIAWNRKLHSQYTALVQKGEGSYEMSETPNTAAPTSESPESPAKNE